ncbi:MAG: hypothetical protein K0Q79_2077 [Flavipsychrobacter sp.]|jgi:hypothetical protein|nr:hypothetical protein [Flavipsychrobacter sp.]
MNNYFKYCLFLTIILCENLFAQNDIKIDQLQTPSSPAFTLLDLNPENVERPKNPTDFAVALANATKNFSVIPNSYAVEMAPFWVMGGGKSISYKQFIDHKNGWQNILQTAVLSAATTTSKSAIDSSDFNQVSVGLKFSFVRGKVGKEWKKWDDSASYYLIKNAEAINKIVDSLIFVDSALGRKEKDDNEYLKEATKIYKNSALKSVLNDLASKTDFKRYGWKLDFAVGSVLDYPNNTFQTCYVSKVGAWLTGGIEKEDGINFLGVVRYTQNVYRKVLNDNAIVANNITVGNIDYGVRVYKDLTEKFTLSLEYVARAYFYNSKKLIDSNITSPKNTDRYVLSLNYKVGTNKNISFSLGKNFDNSIIKINNSDLIAALSIGLGFGSNRPAPSAN